MILIEFCICPNESCVLPVTGTQYLCHTHYAVYMYSCCKISDQIYVALQ